MVETLVFLGVVAALALYAVSIYNRLVRNRNLVQEGWSGIEVQLKRRANLIPNLVEAVKGYMGQERGVLTQVTELRARTLAAEKPGERAQAEGALGRALANLFAVAEAYPDLKSSANFLDLQGQLAEIEGQIQLARRYYNGATRDFNILVQSFPSNLVAQGFNFQPAEYFELDDEADRAVPQVKFP